ncbi:MAG TPA: hypothetical protein VKS19_07695 [Verrucomicrobiae bacterium]|nr:hypothetical protein [Verrucomicrobiae bacterium]
MKAHRTNLFRWWLVVVFAVAMAWMEAAVVFYLRSMMHRIEPYQPDPLPVLGGFASVELPREFATLVMLFAVGWLAGRTWRSRLGYFAVAFGMWDIFYYVFLKIICGWPHSLLDWDVLFLLPMPWWGPVLAPVLISLLLILWGTLASRCPGTPPARAFKRPIWTLGFLGTALALYVFMANALDAAPDGLEAIRTALPERFHWRIFGVALALMAAPLIETILQMALRRSMAPATLITNPNNPCHRP